MRTSTTHEITQRTWERKKTFTSTWCTASAQRTWFWSSLKPFSCSLLRQRSDLSALCVAQLQNRIWPWYWDFLETLVRVRDLEMCWLRITFFENSIVKVLSRHHKHHLYSYFLYARISLQFVAWKKLWRASVNDA